MVQGMCLSLNTISPALFSMYLVSLLVLVYLSFLKCYLFACLRMCDQELFLTLCLCVITGGTQETLRSVKNRMMLG